MAGKKNWGVFLCNCRSSLNVEAELMGGALPLMTVATDPKKALREFARQADEQDIENIVVGCCADQQLFTKALGGRHISFVDLKHKCFAPHHEDPRQAHVKARKMINAAMRAGEMKADVTQNLLEAGGRVLIFADSPAGPELAGMLKGVDEVTVYVSPDSEGFEEMPAGRVNLGWPASVQGRLGAFAVTIERPRPSDSAQRKPIRETADQVVVLAQGELPQISRRRTGLHLLHQPDKAALKALSGEVGDLVGLFRKPEHVTYETSICAGGAADMQTCGRCIDACPYQAIARRREDKLRIEVDHMACEGCGACVAACPTSALTFTEPSPGEIYAQLAGLLDKPHGRAKKQPPVILFHCGEMGARVLREAGERPLPYPSSLLPVEVPCLRYVSEANMLAAMRMGAAGVVLLGCEACPNGERELLLGKMDLSQKVLDAFGVEGARLRMITAEEGAEADAVEALNVFASGLAPTSLASNGKAPRQTGNREIMAYALAGFIAGTQKEPGGIKVPAGEPYGFVEVEESGCTLCRSCANVCPTHAFKFDEDDQTLHYKHISCVGCGLCERACPENVIKLRPELYLESDGLDYMVVVEDEMVSCARCEKPYINRKALETIEAKVLGLESLLDTFAGKRKNLLRMCPDCRAVAAMWDVNQGWEP